MASNTASGEANKQVKKQSDIKRFLRTMFSRKIVVLGAIGTTFFVLVAIFAPLIATHDPNAVGGFQERLLGSSAEHLLGTDYV